MKRKRAIRGAAAAILLPALAAAVLLCFLGAVNSLSRGHAGEDMQRLEEALRRDQGLAHGLNLYRGLCTNQNVADSLGYDFVPVSEALHFN